MGGTRKARRRLLKNPLYHPRSSDSVCALILQESEFLSPPSRVCFETVDRIALAFCFALNSSPMDKNNVEEWVPEHVLKLITLKVMMESLIELLSKLLDRMSNDPRCSLLNSQQELAKKEIEEHFSSLKISVLRNCGSTSCEKEQKGMLSLTTSPINTPKHLDKEPVKIWREEPERLANDREEVCFRGADECANNENLYKSSSEPNFEVGQAAESVGDESESEDVSKDVRDDQLNDDNNEECNAEKNAIVKEGLNDVDEIDAMIEAALHDPNGCVYEESLSYFIGESSTAGTDEKPCDNNDAKDEKDERDDATDSNAQTESLGERRSTCYLRGCMQ